MQCNEKGLPLLSTNNQTYTMDNLTTTIQQRNFLTRKQDDFNGIQDLCRYCDLDKIEEEAEESGQDPQDLFDEAGLCPCCINESNH